MSIIKKIKGTKDYFDLEQEIFNFCLEKLNTTAKRYGYSQVSFPIMEYVELFNRSVGEETDIISKEMFNFNDKGGREIVLRPEGTSSVVRMLLENKLLENNDRNHYYIEKMFRYERPQKGRQREFYQFGIESFNETSYLKDCEIILMGIDILNDFQIKDYELQINYLGSLESRNKYKIALKEFLKKDFNNLSDDSKIRYEKNVLRILDSKDKNDKEILIHAPIISDFFNKEEKENFLKIQSELSQNNISYKINSNLVRGLDYYNNFVFEFVSTDKENMGNQNTIIGGGRYDDLITLFDDKKNIPAVGFALGIERLISASPIMNKENLPKGKLLYLISKDESYDKYLNIVARKLRNEFNVQIKLNSKRNLTKRISSIKKNDIDYVAIINEEYINSGKIEIKNLKEEETNFKDLN